MSHSICRLALVMAILGGLPAIASAETDPRDYSGPLQLPNETTVFAMYYRHVSSSNNAASFSQDVAVFRGFYMFKWGHLLFAPISLSLPVADVTVYVPLPGEGGLQGVLHETGSADPLYVTAFAYDLPETPYLTTNFGVSEYITLPLGSYNDKHAINLGSNRWSYKEELFVGERIAKHYTIEVLGNIQNYTDNKDYAGTGAKASLSQSTTYGFEAHAMADLSELFGFGVSYYVAANGRSYLGEADTTIAPGQTVQTLRPTFSIRLEKQSLLYIQYDQDVDATGGATKARFVGARLSHFFF